MINTSDLKAGDVVLIHLYDYGNRIARAIHDEGDNELYFEFPTTETAYWSGREEWYKIDKVLAIIADPTLIALFDTAESANKSLRVAVEAQLEAAK